MQTTPAIFKAYDIRGIVPSTLNESVALGLGRAFAAGGQGDGSGAGQQKVAAVQKRGQAHAAGSSETNGP